MTSLSKSKLFISLIHSLSSKGGLPGPIVKWVQGALPGGKMGLVCPSQKGKLDPFCWRGGSNFGLQKGKLDPFCWRGGSNFGLQKGKLDPFCSRGGGDSNEGLLDLSRVDLVFFWIESRHFRLVSYGLRLF